MNTKRILIIGGPGTGKSTLISALEENGHTCFHEISREVTAAAQKKGIEQLFLTQPLLFSELLLKGRIQQFQDAEQLRVPFAFYDRGIPDVAAYMDYTGDTYPDLFRDACKSHKYDVAFMLAPWKEIYEQDNERYESFEQALKIQQYLIAAYENYGYQLIDVPFGTVDERISFILNTLTQ
ncbi:AAA family ATPase [Kordia zhangzhouensis]|uniref:AAA family ATPase n=1 Tax=Kordia zhangzhouensis TaxID=1620405 RepID=UPI00062989AC|nr:ATP-binding protein [Kordia zhangzhouensis]